ncbi:MAG: protein translocase subunit SecD [Chloroflexota bacterium]|nr:protein translocase subunit SecD [Chloroflexota bacterium]MDE2940880.1 protein translocase subunit SecD [Chloroflexota bacterium]MDE3268419.1 protein translocase subunit SecD [Chloroflexota bacterium]
MRRFPLRLFILIAVITVLAGASLAAQEIDLAVGGVSLKRGDDTILGLQLGLDLEGGSRLVYQALPTEGESPTQDQMEGVLKTIERRVNAFGVAEPVIQTMGGDRIQVQLPGVGATEATLTFQQDVQVNDIRDVLAAHGRQDATIDQQDSRNFVVEVPSLRPAELDAQGNEISPSERDAIEQALRERFPVVTFSLVLGDASSEDDVRAAMAAAGREGVAVRAVTDTRFAVDVPGLRPAELDGQGNVVTPSEEDEIRATLQEELPSLQSVELLEMSMVVSGGVEEAKRLIGQTAQLELFERTCTNDPLDITQDCDDPQYHVDSPLNLTGEDLVRAYAGTHPTLGQPVVNLEFDSEGARIFAQHTQRIAGTGNRTAFFLDEEFLIAPIALQAITGGRAFIQGPDFTIDRVRTIAIQLESGRLQVPLVLIQEQDVDATLGEDSLQKSVVAGVVGLGLVLLFMALYYRLPGFMACVALIIYSLIVLSILKLWPVTLTIGGLAAFILSIGMAVDANILIFERMKEELRSGRTLIAAIETGFNRAWPAIRDSNVSTFITCAILFWFGTRLGTGIVTGFAITLFIGVAASMFSALTVTKTFLRIVAISPFGRFGGLYTPVQRVERRAAPPGAAVGDRG